MLSNLWPLLRDLGKLWAAFFRESDDNMGPPPFLAHSDTGVAKGPSEDRGDCAGIFSHSPSEVVTDLNRGTASNCGRISSTMCGWSFRVRSALLGGLSFMGMPVDLRMSPTLLGWCRLVCPPEL